MYHATLGARPLGFSFSVAPARSTFQESLAERFHALACRAFRKGRMFGSQADGVPLASERNGRPARIVSTNVYASAH
jgi:hypothetical protein